MRYLTYKQAAERLGCTERTVRNYVESKQLAVHQIPSALNPNIMRPRLKAEEVEALIQPVTLQPTTE